MFESKIILVATLLCFQLMKQSSCNAQTTAATITGKACQPRKPTQNYIRRTSLSDNDVATGLELCLGFHDQISKSLRNSMNALSGEAANKTRKVKAFGKTNHAKNETSRATLVQYLNANQGKRSICIGPELNFADGKMYELVKSVKSVSSLYLITGKNDRLDRVTTEKLILHSSSGEKVTVVLGTSKMWRVYGQGQFNFRVIDSRQMRLTSGFLDMTLTRQVTKWDVTYVLDLALDSKVRYGGLLGDAVWSNGDVNFLESEPLDNLSDQVCYSMSDDQKRVEKYVSSPQQFSPDLLELIDDIAENLPPEVFGNAKKP